MFTNPSRRTPPTHFLYRIPPLNAARFWLARKGRTRCFSVSVRANRLRRWSVRCCTRKRRTTFSLALCEACADDALLRAYCCGFFHTLCHGYDLSPVCLCAFPDGRGPIFRQHALHAGTPAGDPALPPRRSRDGAALFRWRGFAALERRTAQKDCRRAFRCAWSRVFPDSALVAAHVLETCFSATR